MTQDIIVSSDANLNNTSPTPEQIAAVEAKVKIRNIPQDLKSKRQWVVWRYEAKDGRITKVPYNARAELYDSYKKASPTDKTTWSSFGRACQALADHDVYDGLGFVLTEDCGIVGIDGDKIQGTPMWDTLASLDTYCEISPSQTGLRLFCFGDIPTAGGKSQEHGLEIYRDVRFLTITGNVVGGREIKNIQPDLDRLVKLIPSMKQKPVREPSAISPMSRDDQEIIDLALRCDESGRFSALWSGGGRHQKTDGTIDNSVAHYDLAVRLAEYTRNPEQIERLLLASGHGDHEKLQRQKYLDLTISKALAAQDAVYRDIDSEIEKLVPPFEMMATSITPIVATSTATFGVEPFFGDDDSVWSVKPIVQPVPPDGDLTGIYDGLEMYRRAMASKSQYLFENLIESGVITLLSGLPYSGKSLIVLQIIARLLTGREFYGQACKSEPIPVLYINADRLRDKQFYRRLAGVCGDDAVLMSILPLIYFTECDDLPKTVTADYVARLVRGLKKKHNSDTVLVVIDTLRPAFLLEQQAGAENDPGVVSQLLTPIRQVAKEENLAVLLLHHNNRSRDDYSGSAAIAGSTEAVWTISKKDNLASIKIENRESGTFKIEAVLGPKVETFEQKDVLAEFINRFPVSVADAWNRDQVRQEFADLSEHVLKDKLAESERAGVSPRLERLGTGRKGSPYRWFRV